MQMYNSLEYVNNYSMTSGSLWNYYRDEVNDSANEVDDNDNKINNNKTTASKSFENMIKLKESRPNKNSILDAEAVVPLKYLSNFWISLDLPSIICEIELDLTWTKNCVIPEKSKIFRAVGDPPEEKVATTATGATCNAKLYVLVITLSENHNIQFLENKKQGFKRTISWSKHWSEITTQPKNNNLDYLIDPTFSNINVLFVLPFKNGNDYPTRYSFDKHYMSLIEIKDFNVMD